MCKGCLLPIAFEIKKASNNIEEEAAEDFLAKMERKDPRRMKLKDYFIHNFEDKFLLNHSFEPWAVGHLVLQPLDHVTQLHELDKSTNNMRMTDDDAKELISIVRKVFELLDECLTPERIYLCSFNESSDWHLHFHIVPRAKQEVIIGPRLLTSSRREITKKEVENVVKYLKEKLYPH